MKNINLLVKWATSLHVERTTESPSPHKQQPTTFIEFFPVNRDFRGNIIQPKFPLHTHKHMYAYTYTHYVPCYMKYHQFEEKTGISYSAKLTNIKITSNSLESHLVFKINTINQECM